MRRFADERTQIVSEAEEWVLRLDTDPSPECDSEFQRWATLSPRHIEAFLTALAAFHGISRVENARDDALGALPSDEIQSSILKGSADSRQWSFRPFSRVVTWTAIAGAFAATALCVIFVSRSPRHTDENAREYTSPGLVSLGRDSTMLLSENPKVEVGALKGGRGVKVKLIRGVALFSGTHTNEDQLQVIAGHTVIDVLGTTFEVRRDQTAISVIIQEGSIRLSSDCETAQKAEVKHDPSGEHGIVLEKGQIAVISSTGCGGPMITDASKRSPPSRQVASVPEWFSFNSTTVADAVRAFNLRNSNCQLAVSDQALANQRIGGRFLTTDPEGFALFLKQILGVRITRNRAPDGSVLIKINNPRR